VPTLVCFHAHPDDESISTGGTLAKASADGHRVVLVVATNGDHGEVPADLAPGETLVDRRRAETERSAAALGIHRVVWLGYADSGMTGWEQNDHEHSFWQAPVEDAAEKLAAVLREEGADILTTYDWHGNYGHPDHIQVHRVGHRAAELAGTPRVLEATMNRDHMRRLMSAVKEMGLEGDQAIEGPDGDEDWDVDGPADDGNPMGTLETEISLAVDVTGYIAAKRESMRCHASQITDTSFFLQMPDEAFAAAFGTEWFIEPGVAGPPRTGWIFE
jgi:LmbE family N-acetylglucosaminyl deacetylase